MKGNKKDSNFFLDIFCGFEQIIIYLVSILSRLNWFELPLKKFRSSKWFAILVAIVDTGNTIEIVRLL